MADETMMNNQQTDDETRALRARPADDHGFLMGVNYWPRRKAMYWWKDFDREEVREEFAEVASLGADLVRFFLLWEDFQPQPGVVDTQQLSNLVTVMDAAAEHGLQAVPTLLVGNMSGVLWLPPWAFEDRPEQTSALQISGGRYVHQAVRSPFEDQGMLRAEDVLAEAAAGMTADHPALHSWDLANEIDQILVPESPQSAWVWARLLTQTIQSVSGDILVTYGAHPLSLTTRGLTIPALADSLDYLAMHGYPMYNTVARGPLDPEFAPFVTVLTAQLGKMPTMMQEFGLCTAPPGESSRWIEDTFLGKKQQQFLASEEEAAEYYSAVLDRLWEVGAMGAVAWDFADYSRDLWNKPPLDLAVRERTFGLLRSDGTQKPVADAFRRFTRELNSGAVETRLGARGGRAPSLHLDPVRYYEDPERSFAEAYAAYLDARGLEPLMAT
jgi:endo-1,4-beta-mannosidase